MREISSTPKRPPITIEFEADEFEMLAELVWSRARADHPLGREIQRVAQQHGLDYRVDDHSRRRFVAA